MKNKIESVNNSTRRKFLKTTALGVGAIGALNSFGFINGKPNSKVVPNETGNANDIPINLAGYDYYRVQSIINGKVKIKGCSISYTKAGIGDMNSETFSGAQSYDVTEIGLHPFMLAYSNDNFRDYTLLPIFPLRTYRHKSIFIRTDKNINHPEDLIGKTIGTPGYSSTSLTWIRGLLQDEYNVKPEDVQWIISNKDSSADVSGKVSKQEQVLPKGLNIKIGPAGKDESDLLLSGEIDALFHAVEREYYSKTGIFPIMHSVAVKKELVEQNPWIAKAIFDAYSEAKQLEFNLMNKLGWAYYSLPWFVQEFEETRALMGENYWPYGIEPNRKTLETLFRYSYEQGLSSKELTIEDLFHPSSLGFIE
jgi:4,5-dihydroxyphthalate decarboxylase